MDSMNHIPVNHSQSSGKLLLWMFVIPIWVSIAGYGCNIFEEGEGTYQLTAGTLPSTAGQVTVTGTDPVEVQANPNENWSFSHWSGDVTSSDNPLQISLTKNMNIFANFEPSVNQTRIVLRAEDGQFLTDLRFGRLTGATDGFDSMTDLEAPPPPPAGVLSAWFETGGKRLLHDFRNPHTQTQEWNLTIVPGENQLVELRWEMETGSYSGSWILSQSDSNFQIDLSSVNQTTLQIDGTVYYSLTYTANP